MMLVHPRLSLRHSHPSADFPALSALTAVLVSTLVIRPWPTSKSTRSSSRKLISGYVCLGVSVECTIHLRSCSSKVRSSRPSLSFTGALWLLCLPVRSCTILYSVLVSVRSAASCASYPLLSIHSRLSRFFTIRSARRH